MAYLTITNPFEPFPPLYLFQSVRELDPPPPHPYPDADEPLLFDPPFPPVEEDPPKPYCPPPPPAEKVLDVPSKLKVIPSPPS